MNTYLEEILTNHELIHTLDAMFDAVYIVNRKREIVFWNKAATLLTGFSKEEVIGRHCSDNILNHIDENGNLLCFTRCPLAQCIAHAQSIEAKVYPCHKSQKRFPTMTRVGPLTDNKGIVIGAIEIFRDITKDEEYRILQEKFNSLIRKYVSDTTYQNIVRQVQTGVESKATMRDMTILYLDVVGFTAFTERNTPKEVASMLNDLFGICEVITKECTGDIDKFIGDSIMATFVDANDAVSAAKKILNALSHFNLVREERGKEPIELHFGINSGMVIQGEIGTTDRKDMTVLGDVVNMASRIEGISKPNSIFISESTFVRLTDKRNFKHFGKLMAKGKNSTVEVFYHADEKTVITDRGFQTMNILWQRRKEDRISA